MKNLIMTQKFVLSLLMACVLALGVQGLVEAVEKPDAPADDVLNPATIYDVGASSVTISIVLTPDKAGTIETVNISRSSGITLTGAFYTLNSVTLREEEDTTADPRTNGTEFSYSRGGHKQTVNASNVIIPITFTAKGKQTVRISGRDYGGSDEGSWSYTYTYYVKGLGTDTTTVSLAGLSNGYQDGIFAGSSNYVLIHRGDSGHYDVTYTTVPSGGMAQIEQTNGTLGNATNVSSTNLSSSFDVFLRMDRSRQVTVDVVGSNKVTTTGAYIIGTPTLTVSGPAASDEGSKEMPAPVNSLVQGAFSAIVTDGNGMSVPGVVVMFRVNGGANAGGYLEFGSSESEGILVDANNRERLDANGDQLKQASGDVLYIRTNTKNDGNAIVDFRVGTDGKQDVTVSAVRQSEVVSVYAETFSSDYRLVSPQSTSREGKYDVRVTAEDGDGEKLSGTTVQFTTDDGTLDDPSDGADPGIRGPIDIMTDTRGVAFVVFDPAVDSGDLAVTARIWDNDAQGDKANDIILAETVINVRGGGGTSPPTGGTQPTAGYLLLTPTTLSGAAGTAATLTAFANTRVVGLPITFSLSTGSILSTVYTDNNGYAQTTIVLPPSSGYVTASTPVGYGYSSTNAVITVTTTTTEEAEEEETTGEPEELVIDSGDEQQGQINRRLDEDLVVQVLDSNNNGISFELVRFRVIEGSGRVSPTSTRTDRDGLASVTFTPRSQGTVEVEAYLGDLSPVIFTVNVGEPPDAIVMVSGNNQSSRPGTALANPFVVEVVDENDDPVSGTTVTFAVTAGGGTLSTTSATTNNGGRAQTILTLGDAVGDNSVSARVTGIPAVTFTASAGATVLVDASKRAPMYWVGNQNGTLHRLVDGDVEDLATAVMGVTSIAVDSANGLLYFAVQTGNNKGAIRRSGLNGRNAQTLKELTAVPIGIAIDASGSTVYWTNSRGRIQSIAAEGSAQVANLPSNLANPMAIALSNGHVYWGEPLGRIRRVSLTGNPITVENIVTGLGEPLSLAIAKGKIYWLERDAGGGGRLQRANLDGSGIQQVKAFASGVPTSLAIDGSDNKIYWTRSTGKIQRSNLAGKFTTDIVGGLMGPGSIALRAAAADEAPVVRQTTPTTPTTSTTPMTYSKYDINKDGAINNADTKAVAADVGNSGVAIANPRTDVDGSGTVDVTDLILVLANLDDDVAAPAIDVDLQAMDLDFDRVQEQVEVLLASGDRSHAAQRALLYLQHLLASARPDATVLLANYPNPFNPETWIPYHLAHSTNVKINIYNSQGILVRALPLGHQSAGYYTSRSRAAYWDGRNALGERVASGIYFYQLQADEISPMRKMVILK